MDEGVTALADLFRTVSYRWKLVTAIAIGVFAGATLFAESLPNQFDSRAVVAFAPRPGSDADANTVRLVLPKYVAYVTEAATLELVAKRLGEPPKEVVKSVDASTSADSGNLTIKVQSPTGHRAAMVANAMAAEAWSFASGDPLLVAQLVAPALPRSDPSGPPRRLLEIAALGVGLILAVGVAVLLERLRSPIRTCRDVKMATGYPVLGRIPRSRHLRKGTSEVFGNRRIRIAIQTLLLNLDTLSEQAPRVIVVSSAVQREGKTTVAAALAFAQARRGKHVLLVDGNLRRPRLASLLNMGSPTTVADSKKEGSSLLDLLTLGPLPTLKLLSPLPISPSSDPDLDDSILALIKDAARHFDFVIIDTPALLDDDIALSLAHAANYFLLVASPGTTTSSVSEAATAISAVNVRVLGTVLNRFNDSLRPPWLEDAQTGKALVRSPIHLPPFRVDGT